MRKKKERLRERAIERMKEMGIENIIEGSDTPGRLNRPDGLCDSTEMNGEVMEFIFQRGREGKRGVGSERAYAARVNKCRSMDICDLKVTKEFSPSSFRTFME